MIENIKEVSKNIREGRIDLSHSSCHIYGQAVLERLLVHVGSSEEDFCDLGSNDRGKMDLKDLLRRDTRLSERTSATQTAQALCEMYGERVVQINVRKPNQEEVVGTISRAYTASSNLPTVRVDGIVEFDDGNAVVLDLYSAGLRNHLELFPAQSLERVTVNEAKPDLSWSYLGQVFRFPELVPFSSIHRAFWYMAISVILEEEKPLIRLAALILSLIDANHVIHSRFLGQTVSQQLMDYSLGLYRDVTGSSHPAQPLESSCSVQ